MSAATLELIEDVERRANTFMLVYMTSEEWYSLVELGGGVAELNRAYRTQLNLPPKDEEEEWSYFRTLDIDYSIRKNRITGKDMFCTTVAAAKFITHQAKVALAAAIAEKLERA